MFQCFSVYSQSCATISNTEFKKHFSSPKRKAPSSSPKPSTTTTFWPYSFAYSGHFLKIESCNMWSFVNGFFLNVFWSRADSTCQRELLWGHRPCPGVDGIKSHSPCPVPGTILSTLHVLTPLILTQHSEVGTHIPLGANSLTQWPQWLWATVFMFPKRKK